MDEFYQELNCTFFKEWILSQQDSIKKELTVDENFHTETITFINDYASAQVRFNPMSIIELEIINNKTNDSAFYLHFQMNNLNHAKSLYEEFYDALVTLEDKKTLRILLSCSGGLTTSFFAMQLQEAAQTLGFDYEFNAISYIKLFKEAPEYDVILLAPQISYLESDVKNAFPDKIIIKIPPKIFATYDVGDMFSLIRKEIENNKRNEIIEIKIERDINSTHKILILGFVNHYDQLRIGYRIYQGKDIIDDREIIKLHMDFQDIIDILDTVLLLHPDIEMIGLTMPGVINNGSLYKPEDGFDHTNIVETITDKYHIPCILDNDVNSMAVGYYISQNEYENMAFLFQPRGALGTGLGTIINGRLHIGRKSFSGETKYIPLVYEHSEDDVIYTKEGSLEHISKLLSTIIAVNAPDMIVYYCELLPNSEEVYNAIKNYIPEEYIPEIRNTNILKEYAILGEMILCLQTLEDLH